jgi:hypothetical protein
MAVLVAAYVFFGAVLDQVHVLFLDSWFGDVLGTVEDGGELVVLSVSVTYVLGRLADRRAGTADGDLPRVPAVVGAAPPAA